MVRTLTIEEPEVIAAAVHPARAAILTAMRTPSTAAAAARATGMSRQNAAYHVRELTKAGLLVHAGERRNGNFVEQLYVAAAETIVISPRSTWGDDPRRAAALADQLSLEQLVTEGERLQRDAAALLDRAAFDGEEVATASVSAELRFETDDDRAAFLRDYVEMVGELSRRHATGGGDPYRVVVAAYPAVEG